MASPQPKRTVCRGLQERMSGLGVMMDLTKANPKLGLSMASLITL